MRSFLALVCVCAVFSSALADVLPEGFYGKWTNFDDENFDAYLSAKGYSWFTRRLITMATFEKEFTKSDDPKKFDYANLTTKKNVFYKGVELGKEFIGEGLDSTQHKVKFYMKDGIMYEHHLPTDPSSEAKEEEYGYFIEGEKLVVTMNEGDVSAKRFYKRV